MSERILTMPEAAALGQIVSAAADSAKVARLLESGDVAEGTARAIHTAGSEYRPGPGDDLRDCRLHVTTDHGFEVWWPLSELVPALEETTFVIQPA